MLRCPAQPGLEAIGNLSDLVASMPWRSTSYERYYYYRRRRMMWLALAIPIVVWLLWFVTGKYLADPNFSPVWDIPNCSGRRCGGQLILYALIFVFLSLPVWLKIPSVIFGIAELFWRIIALLWWSFDKRPDFAIGPYGIYGMSGFGYHHVPWSKVGGIHASKIRHTFASVRHLVIYTTQKTESRNILGRKRKSNVKFVFAPIHGIDVDRLLRDVAKFAPGKRVIENSLDARPKWLRWLH